MWTVIALVVLVHFSCNIVAITSDGYFGCIISSKLNVFEAHPDTDAAIVDRACLELCRESNKLYSVLHEKTCHCSTSVPEVSGQPFLDCTDLLVSEWIQSKTVPCTFWDLGSDRVISMSNMVQTYLVTNWTKLPFTSVDLYLNETPKTKFVFLSFIQKQKFWFELKVPVYLPFNTRKKITVLAP